MSPVPVLPINPSFIVEPSDSPIEALAGRLVIFPNDKEILVSGSCVRIAKNLYVTAKHVLTDYMDKFGSPGGTISATLWVIHVSPDKDYRVWQVDSAWLSGLTDLAIFHTRPCNEETHNSVTHAAVLRLDPPQVGERVSGFGYHSPKASISVGKDGTRHIVVDTVGSTTVGEVKEVHLERRDLSRLAFPCFQVNARFDGGMSGGPVFDDQGRLRGIICSGMDPYEVGEEYVSYVATLWPLMGIMLDISPDGSRQELFYPALDLASTGVIHVIGWERIQIEPTSHPLTPKVHFTLDKKPCE